MSSFARVLRPNELRPPQTEIGVAPDLLPRDLWSAIADAKEKSLLRQRAEEMR